jgi:hypothetical protein
MFRFFPETNVDEETLMRLMEGEGYPGTIVEQCAALDCDAWLEQPEDVHTCRQCGNGFCRIHAKPCSHDCTRSVTDTEPSAV